jgi:hypothetical protein
VGSSPTIDKKLSEIDIAFSCASFSATEQKRDRLLTLTVSR